MLATVSKTELTESRVDPAAKLCLTLLPCYLSLGQSVAKTAHSQILRHQALLSLGHVKTGPFHLEVTLAIEKVQRWMRLYLFAQQFKKKVLSRVQFCDLRQQPFVKTFFISKRRLLLTDNMTIYFPLVTSVYMLTLVPGILPSKEE